LIAAAGKRKGGGGGGAEEEGRGGKNKRKWEKTAGGVYLPVDLPGTTHAHQIMDIVEGD